MKSYCARLKEYKSKIFILAASCRIIWLKLCIIQFYTMYTYLNIYFRTIFVCFLSETVQLLHISSVLLHNIWTVPHNSATNCILVYSFLFSNKFWPWRKVLDTLKWKAIGWILPKELLALTYLCEEAQKSWKNFFLLSFLSSVTGLSLLVFGWALASSVIFLILYSVTG